MHASAARWVRELNFFSPRRKALRDSAVQLRRRKQHEHRKVKAEVVGGAHDAQFGKVPLDRFANEEILQNNPRIKRLVRRPTAALPRAHYVLLKSGSLPLALADLTVPAPSIFDESKWTSRSAETPLPVETHGRKGKKVVEWVATSKPFDRNAPTEFTKKILGPKTDLGQAPSFTPSTTSLISLLREQAVVFGQTGVNPDLLAQVREAVERAPGIERAERRSQLANCTHTIASLVEQGLCCVENFNLIIRAARDRPDQLLSIHDKMILLGFEPDQETYVSLMVAGPSAEFARNVFLQMRRRMLQPTPKVYGALIKAHVKEGDLASGFALLRKMESEGVMGSEGGSDIHDSLIIHTMLIDGLVRMGKCELAFEQFHLCRTWKSVRPDSVLFSVMIKACIRNAECERALALLEDLRTSGEFPTDITYTHLIQCMATRADFAHKAVEFWRAMQLEGFAMNSLVALALVRACSVSGDLPGLRRTIKEIVSHNLPLSPSIYPLAITSIANSMKQAAAAVTDFEKRANLQLAWHIVTDAKDKGLGISPALLNAVVRVYAEVGQPDHALSMLEQFSEFQVDPNGETYAILLEMLANSSKFFILWDDCLKKGVKRIPDRLFHLALDAAMDSKSSKRTVAVLEAMLERRISPLPDAAGKLAVVGRNIVQIHQVVGKLVALNRDARHLKTVRDNTLIRLDIEEHRARLALEGKTEADPSIQQEAREVIFKKMKSSGSRPKLPRKEHLEVKKKGGPTHARKVDKPVYNILAE